MRWKKGLNEEQMQAAVHRDGPMLVLAGPGTGKTRTLSSRWGALVEAGVDPASILSITFTRRSAEELHARISRVAGRRVDRSTVGTFHAFALGLMRAEPEAFGDLARRRILSEEEQARLVERIAGDLDVVDEGLSDAIAKQKDRLRSVADTWADAAAAPFAARAGLEDLAKVYEAYQRELKRQGVMDFGDLIQQVVATLESDRRLRTRVSRRHRYLMVDEYQDINAAQDALIDLIASEHDNVWVVGDDDQAIYSWRGSDVRYILSFEQRFAGAEVVHLSSNYRSSEVIVEAANGLIAHNEQRYGKGLVAERGAGERIVLRRAADPVEEAAWIAAGVERLVADGTEPGDVAVLLRAGHHATWIEHALDARGLPVTMAGISRFWMLPEVRVVLRAIQAVTELPTSLDDKRAPDWLVRKLRDAGHSTFLPVARRAVRFMEEMPPRGAGRDRKAAWAASMRRLDEEIKAAGTHADFMARIEAATSRKREDENGVYVGTIHSAKGLEWSAVFAAAFEEGILPDGRCVDVEEERRLAFVATTRARDLLHISFCQRRDGQEASRSRFLAELVDAVGAAGVRVG